MRYVYKDKWNPKAKQNKRFVSELKVPCWFHTVLVDVKCKLNKPCMYTTFSLSIKFIKEYLCSCVFNIKVCFLLQLCEINEIAKSHGCYIFICFCWMPYYFYDNYNALYCHQQWLTILFCISRNICNYLFLCTQYMCSWASSWEDTLFKLWFPPQTVIEIDA